MTDRRNYSYIVFAVGQRTSSNFGTRQDPFTGQWTGHAGVDIAVPRNTSIRAAAGGEVYAVVNQPGGYGNVIIIAHPSVTNPTTFTLYGHLSEPPTLVRGATVAAGQEIGLSGNTGRSTGPHLHYEEREAARGVVFSSGSDEQRYSSFFSARPVNPANDKFGYEVAAAARNIDALSPTTDFAVKLASLESRGQSNNGYDGWNRSGGGFGAIGRYGIRENALIQIGWMNPDGTFTERAAVHGVSTRVRH